VPGDIRYPTDLSLLNEGREKLEEIIDTLHADRPKGATKPRTYRQRARKDFLTVIKKAKSKYEQDSQGNTQATGVPAP
jgi:IS5 family transposase